jgi:hypothetical protein
LPSAATDQNLPALPAGQSESAIASSANIPVFHRAAAFVCTGGFPFKMKYAFPVDNKLGTHSSFA